MSRATVSKSAARDIRSIANYTQETWGRAQRRRYLEGLDDAFEKLAKHPELCPERRDFDPPVRIQRYGKHLVIYVVVAGGVLIVRVLHQSQDVAARLG